ncbi:hypothetical protein BDR04DRAFT_250505 [Suillus decipiens]|nr:hypothetical protein BDR04DRAFT_250505 [Suillus decipiens]
MKSCEPSDHKLYRPANSGVSACISDCMATPGTFLHFLLAVYHNLTENNALKFQLMMVQEMNFSRLSYFYGISLIRRLKRLDCSVCLFFGGLYCLHWIQGLLTSLWRSTTLPQNRLSARVFLKDLKDRVVVSCIKAVRACYMLRETSAARPKNLFHSYWCVVLVLLWCIAVACFSCTTHRSWILYPGVY